MWLQVPEVSVQPIDSIAPWGWALWWGEHFKGIHLEDRKQRDRWTVAPGTLSSARLRLLTFPEPPRMVPPVWDQAFNRLTFHIQTMRQSLSWFQHLVHLSTRSYWLSLFVQMLSCLWIQPVTLPCLLVVWTVASGNLSWINLYWQSVTLYSGRLGSHINDNFPFGDLAMLSLSVLLPYSLPSGIFWGDRGYSPGPHIVIRWASGEGQKPMDPSPLCH